jgi:hypothetical protein
VEGVLFELGGCGGNMATRESRAKKKKMQDEKMTGVIMRRATFTLSGSIVNSR